MKYTYIYWIHIYIYIYIYALFLYIYMRSPCSVMAKVLDCSLEISKFKLPSHYYVHFLTNTLEKGMNLIIP